ncbi:MAG: pyruvate kinase [Nitrospiraceae bacterium]|nr:pyruvate kinase [Nitrospiraceae bacterium]
MNYRKSKIICTIGPASADSDTINSFIKHGMDVARLNFSHGNYKFHKKAIKMIMEESKKLNKTVAILQDLQGIKIRVGLVSDGSVQLKKGAEILLHSGLEISTDKNIYVSYPALKKDARIGDRILFDDGLIQSVVTAKTKDGVKIRIIEGGVLKDKKGVNFPGMKTTVSSFTSKDRKDIAFGLKNGVDYVALSFVRNAEDVRTVKKWLGKNIKAVSLIAKIEKPEALKDIDNIFDEVDGIMIARGDLGVEVSSEEVPLIQKALINKANEKGKIVITATQMLESMTSHRRPTRAETTDVANAVIDGTDALMLSAETAAGKYPIDALKMMDRIIRYTEINTANNRFESRITTSDFSGAVADSSCRAAEDIKAKAIIAFTQSGFTGRLMSKFRPNVPIIAFTPHINIKRRMILYWGVYPVLIRYLSNTDEMIKAVEQSLIKNNFARKGDNIVITASSPLLTRGKTNLMKLHTITG